MSYLFLHACPLWGLYVWAFLCISFSSVELILVIINLYYKANNFVCFQSHPKVTVIAISHQGVVDMWAYGRKVLCLIIHMERPGLTLT